MNDLANTNNWHTLTNFTLPSSPYVLIDMNAPSPPVSKRYYRARTPATACADFAARVNCAGVAIGRSGTLIVQVKVCGPRGAVRATGPVPGQTLMEGTAAQVTPFAVGHTGNACVFVFLNCDFNGETGIGDVIPSTGEVAITLTAGQTASATITLDAFAQ